jgi:hypothetical protein
VKNQEKSNMNTLYTTFKAKKYDSLADFCQNKRQENNSIKRLILFDLLGKPSEKSTDFGSSPVEKTNFCRFFAKLKLFSPVTSGRTIQMVRAQWAQLLLGAYFGGNLVLFTGKIRT